MPETGRVRVVVEDERLATTMRRCEGIEVVAACEDGAGALAAIRGLRPDVAVLDVGDGLGILETLAGDGRRPRVLLLSDHPAGDLVFSALAAGAARLLLKEADPPDGRAAGTPGGGGGAGPPPPPPAAPARGRPPP